MNIFAIIPAYNEARNIGAVILELKNQVDEVVVVNDGSTDKTDIEAKSAGARVLTHLTNRGQGAALETGNQYALTRGADIIIHFDGDGQFLATDIPAMIKPIKDGQADLVFGSRFLKVTSRLPRVKQKVIMPLARLINRLFFGIKLTDPQSGFRALSQSAARQITITNDGMAHCSEIMIKTHQLKLRVMEVPITVIYHEFGQKLGGGLKILSDLFLKKLS